MWCDTDILDAIEDQNSNAFEECPKYVQHQPPQKKKKNILPISHCLKYKWW